MNIPKSLLQINKIEITFKENRLVFQGIDKPRGPETQPDDPDQKGIYDLSKSFVENLTSNDEARVNYNKNPKIQIQLIEEYLIFNFINA